MRMVPKVILLRMKISLDACLTTSIKMSGFRTFLPYGHLLLTAFILLLHA